MKKIQENEKMEKHSEIWKMDKMLYICAYVCVWQLKRRMCKSMTSKKSTLRIRQPKGTMYVTTNRKFFNGDCV